MSENRLVDHLTQEEGRRRFPYVDTVGKVTIGVGHNLTDDGLPDAIINALLLYDIAQAAAGLDHYLPWWRKMDGAKPGEVMSPRRQALLDLCFNMGIPALLTFKDTLELMRRGDWPAVADHLRASLWYRQVGPVRGERIARAFETGTAP